ncbi:cyclase family protein [Nocardia sp. NPDC020380]|uniref:cyclase family protein n=1 Tax=Nocardia sp. NPDC020380 TaxID=3364309 RepID=UPI0037BC641B
MRLIDLSSPIDTNQWEPEDISHTILTPAEGARHMRDEMRRHFDLDFTPELLPDGELLSIDTLTLTTHTGTHVDAPAHYGSRGPTGAPMTIDEVPLHWFYAAAVRLDLRHCPVGTVDAAELRAEFHRIGYRPSALDMVLLHTGAADLNGTPKYFTDFTGLDGSAVELLLDLGVRVIGTDAFSLDAPFTWMIREYQRTGRRDLLWPAHFAGRRRPYCQIERLTNLESLPAPHGFRVSAFPVKIARAGAGWARVVAIIE